MKSKKSDCMPYHQIVKSVMKRACKSHLQKTKTEEERYEVCLSGLLRRAGVYFSFGFVRQVGGVGGRRVRDLSPPEQLRLLRRQTMRLLQPLPRKEKYRKRKALKNCLTEIHTLESMADTQKCGRKQICRNPFRQTAPCLFSSVMLKAGMCYARQRSLRREGITCFCRR